MLSSLLFALVAVQEVQHPVEAYLVGTGTQTHQVAFRTVGDRDLPPILAALESNGFDATVGAFDGSECETFGEIVSVDVGPDNRVFVLDAQAKQVRVFSRSLVCLQTLGGEGEGPGEFRTPRSLQVDGRGMVHVLDYDGSIEVFEAGPSGMFHPSRTVRSHLGGRSFCVRDDGYLIHGVNPGAIDSGIFHVTDRSGELERSLGKVYNSPVPFTNYRIGEGHVACLDESLFHAPMSILGEVRRFLLPAGDVRWLAVLEGFRPISMVIEGRRTSFNIPESGYDRVVSLTETPDHRLMVQVAFLSRESRENGVRYDSIYTLGIDPVSGRFQSYGTPLPRLWAWGEGFAVVDVPDLVPRIGVIGYTR